MLTVTSQTMDLFEGANIPAVIDGIHALGRKSRDLCKRLDLPTLGPAETVGNKREFSEDQLRAGNDVIGLQVNSCRH